MKTHNRWLQSAVAPPRRSLRCIRLSDAMSTSSDTLRRLRWGLILSAGLAAGFLTITFIFLAVYAFVVFCRRLLKIEVEPGGELLDAVAGIIGGVGAWAFFLLAAAFAASLVARRAGEALSGHGVATGVAAALAQQGLVYLMAPPVQAGDFATFLALGAVGGRLGAAEARRALADQEDVVRASRDIAASADAGEIAAAIGKNLGGPGMHRLTLWRCPQEGGTPGTLASLASWPRMAAEGRGPNAVLGPDGDPGEQAAAEIEATGWAVVSSANSPRQEGGLFGRGVGRTLLVALDAPGGRRVGLLSVSFREETRLSGNAVRRYRAAGAQAALALEYLRLAEENRRVGREAGTLRERQRLAHEIHDTLAQGFTSVVTNLTAAEIVRASGEEGLSADEQEKRHLGLAREVARESLAETRRLIWGLRPETLERRSLGEVLQKLTEDWSEETGVTAEASVTGEQERLLPEAEVALLRIAQEALANVRKHAGASRVRLTLSYMDDKAVLDVADDGRGFDASGARDAVGVEDRGGFGLTAMRERAEQLGGKLLVESSPGEGTTLAVEISLHRDDDVDASLAGGGARGVAGGATHGTAGGIAARWAAR